MENPQEAFVTLFFSKDRKRWISTIAVGTLPNHVNACVRFLCAFLCSHKTLGDYLVSGNFDKELGMLEISDNVSNNVA